MSAIYILTNISRSKGNQAMKFSQLIEYNMKNIFLEKSYTKCSGETISRPFSKKSKLSISLDKYSKAFVFIEDYRNILKLSLLNSVSCVGSVGSCVALVAWLLGFVGGVGP